jgi:glycosyltransferase involved in cell wall biosynthesis
MVASDHAPSPGRKPRWEETEEAGIHVHRYPIPYSNAMSYPKRILAFLQYASRSALRAAQLPGDIVFATSTPLTIALPGVYAAHRQGIPMVFEVRDLWPDLPIAIGAIKGWLPTRAARWLECFAYKNSAQIVALSPGMKEGIVRTGYPADQVHIIPNAADLELFDAPGQSGIAEAAQSFRQRHDWLQDRPLVVYTGTIGRINGVDYLARLAAEMHQLAPAVRFLVVGDGGEKLQVRETAASLGVLGSNFFIMDSLPKSEMPMILSAADMATSLFIDLPEMWANSANKFFDALASGTPLAINYQGWQAELLATSGAGIVLDVHDAGAAARHLSCSLQDRHWLEEAGLAAKKLAETKFSRDQLSRQLEAILLRAAGSYHRQNLHADWDRSP